MTVRAGRPSWSSRRRTRVVHPQVELVGSRPVGERPARHRDRDDDPCEREHGWAEDAPVPWGPDHLNPPGHVNGPNNEFNGYRPLYSRAIGWGRAEATSQAAPDYADSGPRGGSQPQRRTR